MKETRRSPWKAPHGPAEIHVALRAVQSGSKLGLPSRSCPPAAGSSAGSPGARTTEGCAPSSCSLSPSRATSTVPAKVEQFAMLDERFAQAHYVPTSQVIFRPLMSRRRSVRCTR